MIQYLELKERLRLSISEYLKYSTGLALGNLENLKKACRAKDECKKIRLKIKQIECTNI